MYDTWSILTKAVLYLKYLLSENVSLLILWNSVKQLWGFFLPQGYSKQTKSQLYFVLHTDAAETIPAQVWSMHMGRTVTCPPCSLHVLWLLEMWMGMQRYFFTSPLAWMCSLWGYLWGLAGWNAFWNVPGSEPNPSLECEVKCWRYKYRVWISKS